MKAPDRKDFPTPRIGTMLSLDRMAEKRGDAEWIAARRADPASRFMLLADLSIAVESNEDRSRTALRCYSSTEIAALDLSESEALFLGCDGEDRAVFAIALSPADAAAVPGGEAALKPLVDLRSLANQGAMSADELALAGLARSLAAWHGTSRYCGRCGARASAHDAGWRRRCPACGHEQFPRADPAVIVLITDGERCLLGHHKRYAHKFYSTLAGFVEPGEDIEEAVRREMREETGVRIGAVTYLAAQPWPFPHALMIGCWAEALTTALTLEEAELWDARWFSRDEARALLEGAHADGLTVPGSQSIAHALIRSFVESGGG